MATLAAPLVIAVSFHFLLALPDGRLASPDAGSWLSWATSAPSAPALGLAVAHQPFRVMAGAFVWPLALLCALPAARMRYVRTAGHDRERMQWLGTGLLVAAEVALISAVLHLLIDWPGRPARWRPAPPWPSRWRWSWPNGRRCAARRADVGARALGRGLSAIVAAIYLVIVLGFGEAPDDQPTARSSGCPCSRPRSRRSVSCRPGPG